MPMSKSNIFRNVITQLSGAATDAVVAGLAVSNSLPLGLTLTLVKSIFKGVSQGVMQNCYDDVVTRMLSTNEIQKHERVFEIAERTFMELAEKDNLLNMTVTLDDAQIQYAYEVAEHLTLEAIRQSEATKIDVLGRFYGKSYYKCDIDWQDMHQIISMVSTLTLRQIILIRLITEGFPGSDKELYITNSSVCIELYRLLDYGIWFTTGAAFGIDHSAPIQLISLRPTEYSKTIYDALMLNLISDEDVKRVVDCLRLSKEGSSIQTLTLEDYKASNEWQEF